MKKTKIIYWVFTILFIASMLLSAVPEIMGSSQGNKFMMQLGYPTYINVFLGVAKFLGIIAILLPGYPYLKEWAYAGFCFDLIGATYSQVAAGMGGVGVTFMAIWFVLLFGSYIYHHKRLKENAAK